MSAALYVEGGGSGKDLPRRCREAFRKLLERAGFAGRQPRIVASGSRNDAFRDFVVAHETARGDFVAMLVDSEDPVADVDHPWTHLTQRDGWPRPAGATNDQVFLMITSMETWIVADRDTLHRAFTGCLREAALPPPTNLESRDRQTVFESLVRATAACPGPYTKGDVSFKLVGQLDPSVLATHLPSFARMVRILDKRL